MAEGDLAARSRSAADNRVQALGQLLADGGIKELTERERRVIATVAERRHISRNPDQALNEHETRGERIADQVALFGGSWTFIILFIAFLALWIVLNAYLLRGGARFDGYPFIFLNLMLSMVAALQAPIILMSQNRQAARDRIAAALDYEVNLKAELEIMALHEKVDALRIARLEGILIEHGKQLTSLIVAAGLDKPVDGAP